MPTCSYCGRLVPIGSGLRLFKKDGTSHYYCSRKCIRNHDMGRNPRKMKWTRESAVRKTRPADAPIKAAKPATAKAEAPAKPKPTHPDSPQTQPARDASSKK